MIAGPQFIASFFLSTSEKLAKASLAVIGGAAIGITTLVTRLRTRWNVRDAMHEAFPSLASAVICYPRLTKWSFRKEFQYESASPPAT
jgi:hypothetical protein